MNNDWNNLDAAARSNLDISGFIQFQRYKEQLKLDGHTWSDDAEDILTGHIWDESEEPNDNK